MIESIKEIAENFFSKLEIVTKNLEVTQQQENIFLIKIETDESGYVIGPHGRNLDAISGLLKLMISKKLEKRIVLHLEVNDYLKSKEDKLINFIKSKISYLKGSGSEVKMPFLSSYERKQVHSYIAELNNDIFTKSIGEGKDRRLFLCKKDAKMTIDIDGDDI